MKTSFFFAKNTLNFVVFQIILMIFGKYTCEDQIMSSFILKSTFLP